MHFNGAEPKIIIEIFLFCFVNEEHLFSLEMREREGKGGRGREKAREGGRD